jgi:hypothetical protein
METTTFDSTEEARRALLVKVNSEAADRLELEARYGRVWNAAALAENFEVVGFAAPFVVARRKADNRLGSLLFQHYPRFYFAFQEDR